MQNIIELARNQARSRNKKKYKIEFGVIQQNLKNLETMRSKIIYLICLGYTIKEVRSYLDVNLVEITKALKSSKALPQDKQIWIYINS